MVDWSLARRIAGLAGASAGPKEVGVDMGEAADRLAPAVARYTKLEPDGPLPPAELVNRAEWADANLTTLSHLLDPVAERLSGRLADAGPIAGPLRLAAGATAPALGETLLLVPRHVCPTVNNFDHAVIVRDGAIAQVENVAARGREHPLAASGTSD